ncbi:MAG: SH3 domain-containing protein [Myxococcales bacterium]|nr:SH3 domain-containing protein [Myxococcales bacterium]
MRRKSWLLALAAAVAAAGTALAVKPGGVLYIKAKGTKLMESSSPTAKPVGLLQPGQEVTWDGSDPSNKQWHRVKFQGKSGVVFQSNLSPTKPQMELLSKGGGAEVDPQAFASSGAATKALSEAAVAYGKEVKGEDAVKQLLVVEAISQQIKQEEINDRNRKVGLFTVANEGGAK